MVLLELGLPGLESLEPEAEATPELPGKGPKLPELELL